MKMIKVVPDTNIFINAFFGNGMFPKDDAIISLEENKLIKFATSNFTQNECFKLFCRFVEEQSLYDCRELFIDICKIFDRSEHVEQPIKTNVISTSASDQKFLDLAVFIKADYLITNDKKNKLLAHKEHKGVKIVTPKDFLRQFNQLQKRKTN